MPGRDGTGPRGTGPMTGGGFGPCGRGRRGRFGQAYADDGRFQQLQDQIASLADTVAQLTKKISGSSKTPAKKKK